MPDNYEHYITKNMKAFYQRRLFAPILYLLFLLILWFGLSLSAPLFPASLPSSATLEDARRSGTRYVTAALTDLKFTGYTQQYFGRTVGYYYYTMRGEECIIVLLSPKTCEEGLSLVSKTTIHGRILPGDDTFDALLSNLSKDLNWTEHGIRSKVSGCLLSEPDYGIVPNFFLYTVFFASGGYALVSLILFVIYICFPVFSPPCQNLALFGNPRKLLEQAEEELATLPQLATEDMFITEHFFIETSAYGNAIIPIDQIIWIYKYSTLHKIFWYHFSISYTLHISANRHLYIQCPKNIKSDIDGIIDYLAEANHDILVGFSEQNRLKVQEIQGSPMRLNRLLDFLNRRV